LLEESKIIVIHCYIIVNLSRGWLHERNFVYLVQQRSHY